MADFGINSICKTRWNGNWALTPKWSNQDHLMNNAAVASHQQQPQQAILAVNEADQQQQQQHQAQQQQQQPDQQRQGNSLFLDYQFSQLLHQAITEVDERCRRERMQVND